MCSSVMLGSWAPETYRIGASCHSSTGDFMLMICQLSCRSSELLIHLVSPARSRGRLFQSVPSYSSLLKATAC